MSTATRTPPSGTPILDREAPLPPRAAPGSGMGRVLAVCTGLVALIGACLVLDRPPILRQWLLIDLHHWVMARWAEDGIVVLCVAALAAFYAMLAAHELGHVVAGLVNGAASLTPVGTDHLAARGVIFVPLLPAPIPAFAGLFLTLSLVNALSDLLPFEGRLGV